MNRKREAYLKKKEAQLKMFDERIRQLEARLEYIDKNLHVEYHKAIDALQTNRNTFQEDLEKLKTVGEDSWKYLKKGVKQANNDVKVAFKKIGKMFKQDNSELKKDLNEKIEG
jgi:hypothetical protein